jgi:hypothetical protein
MSTVWKVIAALALILPVGAFVVGSLASSSADEPTRRDPVILREAPQGSPADPAPIRPKPHQDDDPVVIAPEPASTDEDRDGVGDDWDDDHDDRGDDRGDDDRDDDGDEGDDDGGDDD